MKKSDILIDAIGEVDDKTLQNMKPTEAKAPHIIPQIAALAACALLILLAMPIARSFLKSGGAPEVTDDITTERDPSASDQPWEKYGWDSDPGAVIDEEVKQYFPEATEGYEITGHNTASYPEAYIDAHIEKLRQNGFSYLEYYSKRIIYNDKVIIKVGQPYNGEASVSVIYATDKKGPVSSERAIELINENCLLCYSSFNEDGTVTDVYYDPVTCAIDVTPDGFFEEAGFQIFASPFHVQTENGSSDVHMTFVGTRSAVMPSTFFDLSYLYPTQYRSSPLFYDADGDGKNEIIMIFPGPTSGFHTESIVAFETGDTPRIKAASQLLYVKGSAQKLYIADGKIMMHSHSDAGQYSDEIDAYFELSFKGRYIILLDGEGNDAGYWFPENTREPEAQTRQTDEDDKFVEPALIDHSRTLANDRFAKRTPLSGIKVFDAADSKLIIKREGQKKIYFTKEKDGEFEHTYAYDFRYDSLIMLYHTNASDGRYAYAAGRYIGSKDIYRYDLLTGDVYTFIETKGGMLTDTYYKDGVIYYCCTTENGFILKAAVISEKKIYKISENEFKAGVVTFSGSGVYALGSDGVYYCGYDGVCEKVYNGDSPVYMGEDGGACYLLETKNRFLTKINGAHGSYPFYIGISDHRPGETADCDRIVLEFYDGALICTSPDGGETKGVFLYYPYEDKWIDITPPGAKENASHAYTFDVSGGKLYIYDIKSTGDGITVFDVNDPPYEIKEYIKQK